jgi:hypothetical protein
MAISPSLPPTLDIGGLESLNYRTYFSTAHFQVSALCLGLNYKLVFLNFQLAKKYITRPCRLHEHMSQFLHNM